MSRRLLLDEHVSRIDDADDDEVDLTTIAMRVSALLDVIDHAQE